MKINLVKIILVILILTACSAPPDSSSTPELPEATPSATNTSTPLPLGNTIMVTTTADSGPGSLRQAMEDMQPDDTILFDPTIFPPDSPATIFVNHDELPHIRIDNLTLDASNAGVILDGSQIIGDWISGLQIVESSNNKIMGLQISHFPGPGISISGRSENNIIGGDRSLGDGTIGQGNQLSNNVIGLVLSDAMNAITGNLIGTDNQGSDWLGNEREGIQIVENAKDNTIGPNNIIANNGRNGIYSDDSSFGKNTIAQNNIYDNGVGKGVPRPPLIFDFNLAAGTVAGFACANCSVDIYSTSSIEGEIFEGQTIADENGVFTWNNTGPFSGPYLNARTTSVHGRMSEFSPLPTSEEQKILVLQEENYSPRTGIVTEYFGDHPNNWIGEMSPLHKQSPPCPEPTDETAFRRIGDLGFSWFRLSFDFFDPDPVREVGSYSQFEITECMQQAINSYVEKDITIMYTLNFWDEALHAERYPDYSREEDIQKYLDFTRFVVSSFKGRIQYYEILNEAITFVDSAEYINLIERVVPVIREEDPEAKIVVGGSANLLYPHTRSYLFDVIQSRIMPLVDGIATHPMYGSSPQYDETRSYYYNYSILWQDIIMDTAEHWGFTGEYFAEEMAWRTAANPLPQWEPWEYTPIAAAKNYVRGIVINRGLDIWTGIGGEGYYNIPPAVRAIRNVSAVMAGAEPVDLPIEITSTAEIIASNTFSLPDGGYLIAVWTDGTAVDDDPGVETTVTIPGLSAGEAVVIDVMNGVTQELLFETADNNLVIRNLLIRDYPIFIKISDASP